MSSLFKIGRNDPCECGSGRKYKRCCMRKVEEILSRWRREEVWGRPDLHQALALACGLDPREQHRPDPEKVEQALASFRDIMAIEDEDLMADRLLELMNRLDELLETDEELNKLLFRMNELRPVIEELDARLEKSPEDTDPEDIVQELADKYLPGLVTPGIVKYTAWSLVECLRSRDWPNDDLLSIIYAIDCCPDKNTVQNPLWATVFEASLRAVVQAVVDFQKLRTEDGGLDWDRLEEYLAKHPLATREVSHKLEPLVRPAIMAIIQGQITLNIPPFAVAGALWSTARYVLTQLEKSDEESFQAVLESLTQRPEDSAQMMRILYDVGLNLDYPTFVKQVQTALDDWLRNESEEAEDDLVRSVSELAPVFGSELFPLLRWTLEMVYLVAVLRVLAELPVRFHKADTEDEATLDIGNRESWMSYTAYLESIGEIEGAAHVRAVCREDLTEALPSLENPPE